MMAIKEKEVWVTCGNNTDKYYKDKGYEIPTWTDKRGRTSIKRGTKILVKIDDLSEKSDLKVTKICDVYECKKEIPNQKYAEIIKKRKTNNRGLDMCKNCGVKFAMEKRFKVFGEDNCIANNDLEFAKLFWDKKDTFKYSLNSNKKVDFKCPNCENKIINKTINDVFQKGLSCPKCSDGISYPQKFMICFLEQLNIKFENEKIFEWSNKDSFNGLKKYDFYLNEKNIIIETHGIQHYEKSSFEKLGARTLEEEQENDKKKEKLAFENEISSYIVIDCKYSKMEYIKKNILKSQLNKLFDLSNINWINCHASACNSLVKKACDLWNEGNNQIQISKILMLNVNTIRRYLKQGAKANFCVYKPNYNKKAIIQLTLKNDFIKEWESAIEVEDKLKISRESISSVVTHRTKSAGGFKWIYKKDYFYKDIG